MRRRGAFFILELLVAIALFTMGILALGSLSSSGELSPDQRATVRALGVAGRPTMVVFEAPWCGACRAYEPTVAAARKANRKVALRRIDVEEDRRAFQALGFRALPTTLLITADGELAESFKGTRDLGTLTRKFAEHGF